MTKKINQDNINTEFKCPVETALCISRKVEDIDNLVFKR